MSSGIHRRCPRCGSRDLVDVLYGTPDDPALRSLWASGGAMLRPGRCGDGPPGWACRECGLQEFDIKNAAPERETVPQEFSPPGAG